MMPKVAKNGAFTWSRNLEEKFGWGYTESVLVDQGRVICTPGGKNGALAALDAKTGKHGGEAKNLPMLLSTHSIVIEHQGKRQRSAVMKNLVGIEESQGCYGNLSVLQGSGYLTRIYADNHVYISSG